MVQKVRDRGHIGSESGAGCMWRQKFQELGGRILGSKSRDRIMPGLHLCQDSCTIPAELLMT